MILQNLVLLNLVCAAMLTGLIWLVQLVHYPGFLHVGKDKSQEYQRHHTRSISYIVVPLMLTELALSIWLLLYPISYHTISFLSYTAFACLSIVWLATFGFAVPLHTRLGKEGYNSKMVQKLIRINWIRTFFWSLRLILLFYAMHSLL